MNDAATAALRRHQQIDPRSRKRQAAAFSEFLAQHQGLKRQPTSIKAWLQGKTLPQTQQARNDVAEAIDQLLGEEAGHEVKRLLNSHPASGEPGGVRAGKAHREHAVAALQASAELGLDPPVQRQRKARNQTGELLRRPVKRVHAAVRDLTGFGLESAETQLSVPPYVERTIVDGRIDEALAEAFALPTPGLGGVDIWHRVVPVVGTVCAGKSRSVLEGLRRLSRLNDEVAQAQFYWPRLDQLRAFIDLVATNKLGYEAAWHVVFLDDLGKVLDRLTVSHFDRLCGSEPKVVVLATLWPQHVPALEGFEPGVSDPDLIANLAARTIHVPAELDSQGPDFQRARNMYPHLTDAQIAHLGATMRSALALRNRFDAVHTNYDTPVDRTVLRTLSDLSYFRPEGADRELLARCVVTRWIHDFPGLPCNPEEVDHAISAHCQQWGGTRQALIQTQSIQPAHTGTRPELLSLNDAIADHARGNVDDAPAGCLAQHFTGDDWMRAGKRALIDGRGASGSSDLMTRQGRKFLAAEVLFEKAATSDDPAIAPDGMRLLANLAVATGRIDEARLLCLKAIETGHPNAAPRALFLLGLIEEEVDLDQARHRYQEAIETQHFSAAPEAMVRLAHIEAQAGDVDAARGFYQQAIEHGQPSTVLEAMRGLAPLEEGVGALDEARHWYQQTIATRHPDRSPRAMVALGQLERMAGNLDIARHWYITAFRTGHDDKAAAAIVGSALIEEETGDNDTARKLYQLAVESGHPQYASQAMVNLAMLEVERGDFDGARRLLEQAIETGDTAATPLAMVNLGLLERHQGNLGQARHWYQQAVSAGHADGEPRGMYNLGALDQAEGDLGEARHWYQLAVENGHPRYAPLAMINLGILERDSGNLDHARYWYKLAAATPHPSASLRAIEDLAELEHRVGDLDQARHWYREAIGTAHPEKAPEAMVVLANLEASVGNAAEARHWYQQAIEGDHPDVAPMAMVSLGSLERSSGEFDHARRLFEQAIETGQTTAAPLAMYSLGALEHNQGNLGQARHWYQKTISTDHTEAGPMAMVGLGALDRAEGDVGQARNWYEQAIKADHELSKSEARRALDEINNSN